MNRPFEALYLHIPFCVERCDYCDFHTSAVGLGSYDIDLYIDKMAESLARASAAGLLDRISTIYIGGGTPSYLGAKRLERLLAAINSSVDMAGVVEFTVEANPDSFNRTVAAILRAGGVNRISIGIQSLDDSVLRTLGRVHDSATAIKALRVATSMFGNVSADVICGVMGQSDASLRDTLLQIVDLGVCHLSIYPLMVEDGTPLSLRVEAGELPDIDEDAQADQMLLASHVMESAGMPRYEVASYARKGCESRHNTVYWTGKPYLGLGDGASSMLDVRDLSQLLSSGTLELWANNSQPLPIAPDTGRVRISLADDAASFELLTKKEAACEDAMLGMRLVCGISKEDLVRFEQDAPTLAAAADHVVDEGLAEWRHGRLVPTTRGWLCGNELFGELWGCASS